MTLNENTLKLITQTSLAILVLGVLVWALDKWDQERARQAESQERQRVLLIEIMTGAVNEAHQDRRQLTETIQRMSQEIIERGAVDARIIELLEDNTGELSALRKDFAEEMEDISGVVRSQGKTITRSIQSSP